MDFAENNQVNNTGEKQVLYKTQGTCSQFIEVAVKDGIITRCQFHGGCMGNTRGVASLVVGMDAKEAISKLKGIQCGNKGTSCPDQLSCALEQLI